MHSQIKKASLALAVAVLGAVTATPTFAVATWTWALDTNGSTNPNPCTPTVAVNGGTSSNIVCSATPNTTTNKATFSGWSDTGDKSTQVGGGTFERATVYSWGGSGYGVVNRFEDAGATGPHATDNVNGLDLFLVQFDSAVSLSEVKVGWNGSTSCTPTHTNPNPCPGHNDSDMSIYRFDPTKSTSNPASYGGLTGLTAANLTTSGSWQFVKNYSNASSTVDLKAGGFDTGTSSWWLISAYNSNSGGSFGSSDAFKLLSVGAVAGAKVSEPASLALLGIAALGAFAARRRSGRVATQA